MNVAFAGLALAGATALGMVAAPSPALAAGPSGRAGETVLVQNNRSVPVVVYLEEGDFDTRLGTVSPMREAHLSLPRRLGRDDDVRIVVHPEVGRDLESGDIAPPGSARQLAVLVPRGQEAFAPPPPERIPNPGPVTTLTVENTRAEAVKVVVEKGDFDTDVGTVEPFGVHTFDLPASLAREPADVQIFLVPRSGVEMASHFFTLRPHAHLGVKVPPR